MESFLLPHGRGAMMVRETRGRDTAERALRESEVYFRALVENARDIIHVINADGTTRSLEFRARHRDGGWRVFEAVGKNLLDDPLAGAVVVNSHGLRARLAADPQARNA